MASSTTQPTLNMVPKYEVKLLMNPTIVLNSDQNLTSTVQDVFKVTTTAKKINLQFVDTNSKDIYKNRWSLRIRKMEGETDFELTYKRRYTIVDGDIEAALTAAKADGFNSTTTTFKSQVDWGYKNQTLSIHRDESYSDSGSVSLDLPDVDQSRKMLIEKAPDKFDNSVDEQWGTDKLKDSRIYGSIPVERYTGNWGEEELDIEVWPIKDAAGTGTEYIVEVSFKVRKRPEAVEKHQKLMDLLIEEGWFLAKDSLKTSLIMERY